jgi:hypothetical protein
VLRIALPVAAVAVSIAALAIAARPQYDPYGWLLWGRELATGSPAFSTINYPSWKPLGAMLGFLVQPAAGGAPELWLVLTRVAGLAGLAFAYAVARQASGRGAGALAAGAVALTPGWLTAWLDGHLEPLVAALVIGAVWLDLRARSGVAVLALGCAALARPEAFAALCIYTVVLARRRHDLPLSALACCFLVPALWAGGDALGSGSLDHGGALARASRGVGPPGVMAALAACAGATMPVLAVAAVLWLIRRARSAVRTPLFLGAAAGAWLLFDVLLAAVGYPADPRYVTPAGALLAVLGAIGLVSLTRERKPALGVAAAAAVAVCALPALQNLPLSVHQAQSYAAATTQLQRLLTDRSTAALDGCPLSVEQAFRAPVAWYTDREIAAVSRLRAGAVALLGRTPRWPRLEHAIARGHVEGTVARAGPWRARLLAGRERPRCYTALARIRHVTQISTARQRGRG